MAKIDNDNESSIDQFLEENWNLFEDEITESEREVVLAMRLSLYGSTILGTTLENATSEAAAELQATSNAPDKEYISIGRSSRSAAISSHRPSTILKARPIIPGYILPPDSLIGEGLFSAVYRAHDRSVSRDVAIKVLREGIGTGETQQLRMNREANALASLQGTAAASYVVQLYSRSQPGDASHFMVLELLENGSLAQRLRDQGPMEARSAAAMIKKIAEAMNVIHEHGIIHRDLKPSNILLTAEDQPKLADFGTARFEMNAEDLTLAGEVLGTAEYMSPEQAAGRDKDVGPSSDLYSLGAVLYECLTGTPPFRGSTFVETISIVKSDEEPVPPGQLVRSVPRDLSTICLKCLNKKKEARYHSAAELANDLGRYLDGLPIHARRAGLWERFAKLIRRNKQVSSLIGLIIAIVVAAFWAIFLYAQKAKWQETRANENANLRFQSLVKVLDEVTGDRLRRSGQRALQVQLINDLLPQFEAVLKLEGDEPATRNLQGLAWENLAVIRRELGDFAGALEALGKSEQIFRELLSSQHLQVEASIGLGKALGYKGSIVGQAGNFKNAIAMLNEAAELLEPYAKNEDPIIFQHLGHVHNNWANCLKYGKEGSDWINEAERHYRKAIDFFQRGAVMLLTCRDWQARSLSNLALFFEGEAKRPKDAEDTADEAVGLSRSLYKDHPNDIDSRECLATALMNQAEIRSKHGKAIESIPLYRESLALFDGLASQVSDSFEFRWDVAMSKSNLGWAIFSVPNGDWSEAYKLATEADLLYQELVRKVPDSGDLNKYASENSERLRVISSKRRGAP